ncbi:hypothetical protein LCGC14_0823570 [marine sediment metagenome]|uniref:Uncharacterized protein n=1 Tax=marine sediment metagenome TaxID=412755 RepID=A0A0F9PMR6_9ZZZZ
MSYLADLHYYGLYRYDPFDGLVCGPPKLSGQAARTASTFACVLDHCPVAANKVHTEATTETPTDD